MEICILAAEKARKNQGGLCISVLGKMLQTEVKKGRKIEKTLER
jgi:hypothetical protein